MCQHVIGTQEVLRRLRCNLMSAFSSTQEILLETLVTRVEYGGTRPSWRHIDLWANWSKTATADDPKSKMEITRKTKFIEQVRVAFSRGLTDFFYKRVN